MTIQEAKQKLVNWCNSQVGYHESWDGANKYGAESDWDTKLYGFDASNVPWCDWFCDYAYIFNFGFDQAVRMTFQQSGGSALCRRSAELYQQHGHLFYEPEVGDQIFFYYGGEINHTGIVTAVNGDNITCVEGNYSDGVGRTYYNWRISNQIAGYGRPDWSIVSGEQVGNEEMPVESSEGKISNDFNRSYPVLRYGDGINHPKPIIKAWQNLMLAWGYDLGRWGADGEFGSATQTATMDFQRKVGIAVDGVVGEQSWKQAIYLG